MHWTTKPVRIILIAVATVSLLLAGFLKVYPAEMFFGTERAIVLDRNLYPISHRAGLSYRLDLDRLRLDARAANVLPCPEMRVRFFEDGQPLVEDDIHERIEKEPGRFSHWLNYVVFSPRGGAPDGVYSVRYLELDESWRFLKTTKSWVFWSWSAALCLAGLAALGACTGPSLGVRSSIILYLALAGMVVPHVVKYWDRALTMPDSESYVANSARPPLYPWFIRLVTRGTAWSPSDFAVAAMAPPNPSEAILRVVRAQRIVFWLGYLLAAGAASLLLGRPLAALFFFGLYILDVLLPELENSVMSEPLALSFLFVVVAAFCVLAARRQAWPLPLLAAAYGCLVLTRSAGVFAVVFLAVALALAVVAEWRRPKALAGPLVLTGLVGIMALGALLWNSHARNGVWTLAPLRNWERIAFALQVADLSDLEACPDADARQFLEEAIRQRLARKGGAPPEEFDVNVNCWEIACPVAEGMLVARSGKAGDLQPDAYSPPSYVWFNRLFGRVADAVLARHRDRYWRVVAHSFFAHAVGGYTRLHWRRITFPWLLGMAFVGCAIGRNKLALAGVTFLAAHLANLVVMVCCEMPLQRYVFFSEWICLFGFLLAALGCGHRLAGTLAGSRRLGKSAIGAVAC